MRLNRPRDDSRSRPRRWIGEAPGVPMISGVDRGRALRYTTIRWYVCYDIVIVICHTGARVNKRGTRDSLTLRWDTRARPSWYRPTRAIPVFGLPKSIVLWYVVNVRGVRVLCVYTCVCVSIHSPRSSLHAALRTGYGIGDDDLLHQVAIGLEADGLPGLCGERV